MSLSSGMSFFAGRAPSSSAAGGVHAGRFLRSTIHPLLTKLAAILQCQCPSSDMSFLSLSLASWAELPAPGASRVYKHVTNPRQDHSQDPSRKQGTWQEGIIRGGDKLQRCALAVGWWRTAVLVLSWLLHPPGWPKEEAVPRTWNRRVLWSRPP